MAMDVDSASLQRLLDLQTEDSAIARLEHQRAALPEAARLAELEEQLAELGSDLGIARQRFDDIQREVAKLEGEIELIDQKIAREEQRMFSGSVSNPKELSALQAEVESLKRKKSGIEDQELEAMEVREQAQGTIDSLTKEAETARAEATVLSAKVAELTQDIEAQLTQHRGARTEIAPSVPDKVLSLYEQLRDQKHGIGAAALVGGTCQGCHTKLPAKEVERLRAEGGLQRCDNCRRILVVS